jgi:hypothetical protein
LNKIYSDKLFSIYFNNITEDGMANTPRVSAESAPITIDEAVQISDDNIKAQESMKAGKKE